jgi:lipid-binding SYLF domain-containing protein
MTFGISTGRSICLTVLTALALLAGGGGGGGSSQAASGREIDREVNITLDRLYRHVPGGSDLAARAAAILVFPTVIKAGIGVGGEYGEGALRIGGVTQGYYDTLAASFGFQFGAEARSIIIMFMTPGALENFRRAHGWKVGVDGSVAIITIAAGAAINTENITSPVVGIILDTKGLMYNLTLEGSKITRISR